MEQCRDADKSAAAELGAWILGDLLHRIDAAESVDDQRTDARHVYASLFEEIYRHEEGWFGPYLGKPSRRCGALAAKICLRDGAERCSELS